MNGDLVLTFAILAAAVFLFLRARLRNDLVALLTVVALGITGVLTPQEAFSGFSRSAVVTITSIFILTDGLQRTGVTEQVGNILLRAAGRVEQRLIIIVMVAGAFLSLFMNNIAAASLLLPAAMGAAHKAGVSPSRLLIPLAFATILGGMATLFTTTNIVVSGLLRDQNLPEFGVLDFAPVGLPVVVVGIVYMAVWGRHRLPDHSPLERIQSARPGHEEDDLVGLYLLDERLFRARVPPGSSLHNKPLMESNLRERYGISVVAVERDGEMILSPMPEMMLHQGDVVLLGGDIEDFRQRDVAPYLEILPPRQWREQDLESSHIVVVEVVLAPRSRLIGATLRQVHFRAKYGMTVLAIWRAGRPLHTNLNEVSLLFGDALLLMGPRSRLPLLRAESDLLVLSRDTEIALDPSKGRLAFAIMVITLILASLSTTMIGEIMLGGALAMILARVLTMDQAYQAIEWKSVFLIAGMLPMGVAMSKTGAAALLGQGLISLLGPVGPYAVLVGLFGLTTLLTQTMNGAAVAAVVGPIAIQAAHQSGADPRTLAMAVALATSMAFLTPLGHAVNILVMGPGGYTFKDYFWVGLPLTLLLFGLVVLLLPLFWPLVP